MMSTAATTGHPYQAFEGPGSYGIKYAGAAGSLDDVPGGRPATLEDAQRVCDLLNYAAKREAERINGTLIRRLGLDLRAGGVPR